MSFRGKRSNDRRSPKNRLTDYKLGQKKKRKKEKKGPTIAPMREKKEASSVLRG